MDKSAKAKSLLTYYFRMIAQRSGINWDSDNDVEIEDAIDYLIEAAIDKIKEKDKE